MLLVAEQPLATLQSILSRPNIHPILLFAALQKALAPFNPNIAQSIEAVNRPRRPTLGTEGQPIALIANWFDVSASVLYYTWHRSMSFFQLFTSLMSSYRAGSLVS